MTFLGLFLVVIVKLLQGSCLAPKAWGLVQEERVGRKLVLWTNATVVVIVLDSLKYK